MDRLQSLIAQWRGRAALFREHGHEPTARTCELHAQELEAALHAQGDEVLSLEQAAQESGYSVGHLGRMVREGRIPNAGRANAPKVHRRELPRKAHSLQNDVVPAPMGDRLQIARSIVNPER